MRGMDECVLRDTEWRVKGRRAGKSKGGQEARGVMGGGGVNVSSTLWQVI